MLELHVWGPAFGLASIDAECLATIAYFAQTKPSADYQLIQSSPSAVPTHHLPALHDTATDIWITSYASITGYLSSRSSPSTSSSTSRSHRADATAYTAFLTAHAAPLLALSLYVSSANWASATRPAYSAILPLPLPWTEPPAMRAAMAARTAHLGLSSLDTDAEAADKADAGWVQVPAGLRRAVHPRPGVAASLTPEQAACIKLEGLAADVLDVLAEVEWDVPGQQTLALRCLAFAYLALMLVPLVPRPWLREAMTSGRYGGLVDFVQGARREWFVEGALPWMEPKASRDVVIRFAHGLAQDIPIVGAEWRRWWAQRRRLGLRTAADAEAEESMTAEQRAAENDKRQKTSVRSRNSDLIQGAGLALLAAVNAGMLFYKSANGEFFYRGSSPFGELVQTWRPPPPALAGFGAVGAMFSGMVMSEVD
ncbi:Tom37 C-terminal domain-containing protein [Podospora appendiculata]|uniref:Tom37 C-terminal domain-containing protein n=1 Tax=Podospora appendiculata TaxID=314037 RepID=A0AAE1CGN8_9PEZI|nr:Tom37 C-terminal domain-containing protein [Podospora appendiculata]